jgi:hydroxymethylpyrimidine pyrophosphatase-like HAD family hydrolase
MRVYLPTPPDVHRAVRRRARERFLGRAVVVWGDTSGVELPAPSVNKGEALAWLAATLGHALNETAATGDATNDTEMPQAGPAT